MLFPFTIEPLCASASMSWGSRRPSAQLWTVIERNSFSLTFFESHLIWHAFFCEINITFIKLFCWDTGWGNSLLLCDKVMSESQCTQLTKTLWVNTHRWDTVLCMGWVGWCSLSETNTMVGTAQDTPFCCSCQLKQEDFFFQKVFHNKQFLWLIRAAEGAALTSLTLILTTAA